MKETAKCFQCGKVADKERMIHQGRRIPDDYLCKTCDAIKEAAAYGHALATGDTRAVARIMEKVRMQRMRER